ncbi:MAG TPA: ATP-dependent DNA helicase RecQ [Thermoanaerobaculia bacterium]|jgi:ATP-dependent DNA helicase RecQ|nr:ATP-dependent DNA helicase RecQ [Thermoanaerobaculia bacterium]
MTQNLLEDLSRHFGHQSFRPGQEEIVRAVIAGRDVLAVMPTGSGKSLGYQLPALLLPGMTLVVSPLIALMKDQVDELNRKGISAAALHSLAPPAQRRAAIADARRGALRLLYVAPERFASESFLRDLLELPLARFAVDEAHCVSEWGHDFRPDYRRLDEAARRCRRADGAEGRPPVIAFTATATPEVREDIVTLLGLDRPEVFVAGFDRPNLFFDVRHVSGALEKRALLPDLVAGRRALVYSATRKSTERAAETLRAAGIEASAYHAGLEEHERTRVQNAFAAGRLPVVCATNAFGMGIDRPDVEAVVHFEIPGSLEAYYQEIGRGGRDGRPATVTLLWNYVDVRTQEFFIERDEEEADPARQRGPIDAEQRERKRELDRLKLKRMIAYADSTACLRSVLLGYFGEPDAPERCGNCGNCARRRALDADELLFLRKILSGVARAGERFGKRKIVAMLRGELEDLPEPLKLLSTTGLLASEDPKKIGRFLDAAVGAGLLAASNDVYRTLSLTRPGREVMTGKSPSAELALSEPSRAIPREKKARATKLDLVSSLGEGDGTNHVLFETLKSWRRREATERSVPAYVVFHDRTLATIAAVRPRTLEALGRVPGVGPVKLEAYGKAILELIPPG